MEGKNILIVGPAGSGKSTKAEQLVKGKVWRAFKGSDLRKSIEELDYHIKENEVIVIDEGSPNDSLYINGLASVLNRYPNRPDLIVCMQITKDQIHSMFTDGPLKWEVIDFTEKSWPVDPRRSSRGFASLENE